MTTADFCDKMSELERAAVAFRDEIGKLEIQLANSKACQNRSKFGGSNIGSSLVALIEM